MPSRRGQPVELSHVDDESCVATQKLLTSHAMSLEICSSRAPLHNVKMANMPVNKIHTQRRVGQPAYHGAAASSVPLVADSHGNMAPLKGGEYVVALKRAPAMRSMR